MGCRFWRRVVTVSLVLTGALGLATTLSAQPPGQDGFVPVTGVPVTEQIPAAPLVVGAYAFFLLLMMFYLWTIWRRIGKVEDDMRALERRHGSGPREP
jgi:hypothetical protein